jgi:WXG100 family type VII secretion target
MKHWSVVELGVVAMAEGKLRVDLAALASSAAHVDGQAEDLATAHLSSDNRIASAQAGWVGSSAASLAVKTEIWLQTSRRLVGRVGGHAIDLNSDGIAFADMEQENAESVRAVMSGIGGVAGSAGA